MYYTEHWKFNNGDHFLNALIGVAGRYTSGPVCQFKHQITTGGHNHYSRNLNTEQGWQAIRDEIFVKIEDGQISIYDGNGDTVVEYKNSREGNVVKSEMKYLYLKIGSIPVTNNAKIYITENP